MHDETSPLNDTAAPEKRARISQAISPRSKTDVKYWRRKIFRPVYTRADGTRAQAANFAVEICFRGRRIKWSLDTPNKEAAAARAKELFLYIQANGWEAALARYRPEKAPALKPGGFDITVGEFLSEVQALGQLSAQTFDDYREAFRRIVSGILGISGTKRKCDSSNGGHDQCIQKIGAVKLHQITADKIERWKREFLAKAKPDPISQRSARVSVNSYLRRAKCLFGKQILKHFSVSLPDPLPFAGVEFERRPSLKYHSSFDVRELVARAKEELADGGKTEEFKIFILGAMCGLRRREIDLLPWIAFRWDESVLRIEATEFFHPKSEESIGDIPLERELCALFRGYHARATSDFVIESEIAPAVSAAPYLRYRCLGLFKNLCRWLRAHGVKTFRPLHVLRKEYGSVINRAHGIHAASLALRHASIGITAEIYVDSRVRTTSGLGYLLAAEGSNVLPIKSDDVKSSVAGR